MKQQVADSKDQIAALSSQLESVSAALKACKEASSLAVARETTAEATTEAPRTTQAPTAAAVVVDTACAAQLKSVSEELLSCNTRVETLGTEAKQLQQKLDSESQVKTQLDKAKAELLEQSKKMDTDAMKLIDVSNTSKEKGVQQAVNAVKVVFLFVLFRCESESVCRRQDDLIKESVKVEGVVDRLSNVKEALQQNVAAVRDAAIKLERDIALPAQSPGEQNPLFALVRMYMCGLNSTFLAQPTRKRNFCWNSAKQTSSSSNSNRHRAARVRP